MSDEFTSVSPQNPSDVVLTFAGTSRDAVHKAAAAARDAQRSWAAASGPARAGALFAAADLLASATAELVALGVREVGKPIVEMEGEVARGVAILRYFGGCALDPDGTTLPSPDGRSLLLARHRPVGLIGCITPWNFPVAIPLWKVAPALAYGNGVLLKPAPQSTAVAVRLAEIIGSAFPGNLFSVLPGGAETGTALVDSVDALSFTGSESVGHLLGRLAAERALPYQAEMGGNNASIIFDDANPETAARFVAESAMGFAGQKCTATSRVILVGSAERFADAIRDAMTAVRIGDPLDRATQAGPVIDDGARKRYDASFAESQSLGGRMHVGSRPESDGYFVPATLIEGLDPFAPPSQRETFAPFAVLLHATNDDDAIRIANSTPYGLVASLYTASLDRALNLSQRLETGMVKVNAPTTGVDFYAPFGGAKASSMGPKEQGKAAAEFYTVAQTLTVSPAGL